MDYQGSRVAFKKKSGPRTKSVNVSPSLGVRSKGKASYAKSEIIVKPASIGIGVSELRVHQGGAFRVIYVAKFNEAIHVLHAFQKKSRRTAWLDIELARSRFRALINERAHG